MVPPYLIRRLYGYGAWDSFVLLAHNDYHYTINYRSTRSLTYGVRYAVFSVRARK